MSLREEIKQVQPFQSVGHEAAVSLLRTASKVKRSFEAVCKEQGITLQQFNVLRILRGAGDALPTMEIADRMVEYEPGITRLVDRIVAKGLIEKSICKEDARRHLCKITNAGLKLLRKLDPLIQEKNEQVVAEMTADQARELVGSLAAVRRALP